MVQDRTIFTMAD